MSFKNFLHQNEHFLFSFSTNFLKYCPVFHILCISPSVDLWVSAVLAIVSSAALILVVQKSLQVSALHSLGFFFKIQYSHLLIFIRIIVHTGSIIIKEKVLGIIK